MFSQRGSGNSFILPAQSSNKSLTPSPLPHLTRVMHEGLFDPSASPSSCFDGVKQ